jgi:hypothetical protein
MVVLAPEAAPTPAAVPPGSGGTKPPPRLHWRRVKGADYYNVQLYRGSRKVLSVWPASTHLQLGMRWRFHGRLMRLSAAHYDWYAWPGFGRRSQRRYGRLIVHGKFTFSATEAARAARRLGL